MTGSAKSVLSTRSRKPPWPGRMPPLSLTFAPRFMADSARSPNWPATLAATVSPTASGQRHAGQEALQVKRAHHGRGDDRSDRAFPGFLGADARRQLVFAEGPADIVRADIAHPVEHQAVHQPVRTDLAQRARALPAAEDVDDAGDQQRGARQGMRQILLAHHHDQDHDGDARPARATGHPTRPAAASRRRNRPRPGAPNP